MSSDKSKQAAGGAKGGGILDHAFKSGLSAAEDIHKRAFQIPIDMLEGMGAPQDKVDMLRDKSQTMIGELYSAINSIASQVSPAKPDESEKD